MLPDGWKDWKSCTGDNLYIVLGLDPEKADSYVENQIKSAYRERYEWFVKRMVIRNSPRWESKIDLAYHNLTRALSVLTNKERKKKYDEQLRKE